MIGARFALRLALLLLALVVVAIGIMTIYSANYNIAAEHAGALPSRQMLWLGLGFIAMFEPSASTITMSIGWLIRFTALMLLLLFSFSFVGHSGGGSQRWINLGFFRLQPSEPAKLAIVLVMAKYFQTDEPPEGYRSARPLGAVCPGCAVDHSDLGPTGLGHGYHSRHCFHQHDTDGRPCGCVRFLYLVAAGLAFLPIGWHFLKAYQRARILTFLDPDRDPLGAGYHVIQSKIAIGSGRIFGKGYLHGTQNRLDFLPAQHTDFIFAVFLRRVGFCGLFDLTRALLCADRLYCFD